MILSLLLIAASGLRGQPYDAAFAPDAGFADVGARSDPLPVNDLETAALLASGLSPAELPAMQARLDADLRELASSVGGMADPSSRAEATLGFLHRRMLRAYRADATTLDGILTTGLFNCVSSAVLYMIAARSLGLDVGAVQTSDHAFCVVHLADRSVDVETTNPEGYDPGTKRSFTDSFGRVTGFSYVPPGDYGRRNAIGGKALVGLILSNRVVLAEAGGDYRLSLRLGVDYDTLERSPASRSFLIDRVNNLAADLVQRGDYPSAERLAAAARVAVGEDPRLLDLERKAAYMGAAALAQAGRWDAALDAAAGIRSRGLDSGELESLISAAINNEVVALLQGKDFQGARRALDTHRDLADPRLVSSLGETIGEAELAQAVRSLPFQEALAAARRELDAGFVDRPAWERATDLVYLNEANRIAHTGDWLAASRVAAEGSRLAPGDGTLERAAQNYRANFVAVSHNAFAGLYNARKFAQARDYIRSALDSLPDDPTLLQDLALANRALGQ
ncbi:MAG TPA: hypothetical protein VMC79_16535 [Rectinemataceae bacterium]|nr:hypothetical protein [Rectinemataceae bacterium]